MNRALTATCLALVLLLTAGCGMTIRHTGVVTVKVEVDTSQLLSFFDSYCEKSLTVNGVPPTAAQVTTCSEALTGELIAAVSQNVPPSVTP